MSHQNSSYFRYRNTNSNWRQSSQKHNVLSDNNLSKMNNYNGSDDGKFGEKDDDDLESCYSVQTQVFIPNNTNHRYNRYNNNRYSTPYNESHNESYNDRDKTYIQIKANWRQILYTPTNEDLNNKISQMIKYGERAKEKQYVTLTEYLIYYGTRILHTNINGDIIGLYEGAINVWYQWFYLFLGGNINYDLNKVFSRIDLFGNNMICGVDFCKNKDHRDSVIMAICKKGWLDGLKYIVEKLKIIPINTEFKLLVESIYRFNDEILKYLLIQNNFYDYFDIDTQQNKYKETLWVCCKKQFENITKPGLGWLHCLECLHYAPYLIDEIYGNIDNINNNNYDNDEKEEEEEEEDKEEGNDDNNWMIKELNEINLNIETIELPKYMIHERLNIIHNLCNNKRITFKLESCYYGLCADVAGSTLHCIHFWRPHIRKQYVDNHFFEYIPCHNNDNDENWGRLRMSVSDKYWLTVISKENMVKLCPITVDDSQLWRIEQVELENKDKIWIRIINKMGYKLIFSWKTMTHSLSSSMPLLSISKKINEIDPLCMDIFSVAKNNQSTKYYLYYKKYQNVTKQDILRGTGGKLNRSSFWRLSIDGSKFFPTKYDHYKLKLKNIAKILWQFKQRYIQSLNNLDDNNVSNDETNHQKRRPSPPPPPSNCQYE